MTNPWTSPIQWTEAKTADLCDLWQRGLSASECARDLGTKYQTYFSRSAVIGKVFRLGLCGQRKPPQVLQTIKARVRARPTRSRKQSTKTHVRRALRLNGHFEIHDQIDAQLPVEMPMADVPIEQRKSLVELTNYTCRFPYGEPGNANFFFCGKPEADLLRHRPYCRFHSVRARGVRVA